MTDTKEITNGQLAKACTPDEPGKDRPALKDVSETLRELKAMPEQDREELRSWM